MTSKKDPHGPTESLQTAHVTELKSILKADQISQSPQDIEHYGRDWTKFHAIKSQGVLFPSSTEEVQALVLWAKKNSQALVPSGGRTGLSGGAIAHQGEWIISLERMNRILDFNPLDRTILCQSGAITKAVQTHAEEKGYFFPVDFASTGSSTMGGMVATNAGGVRVLKYGLTRNWITSLTVVTGKGDVLHLNQGLIKNATGYDFRHLIIGSEGTLAFVTEVEVNLTTAPKAPKTLILGLSSLSQVEPLFIHFRDNHDLLAFELFCQKALDHVLNAHPKLSSPLSEPCEHYVLVEVDAPSESLEAAIESSFEVGFEKEWILDGAMAQSQEQREQFWALREFISESIAPFTPYKNDVSVRVSKVTSFMEQMGKVFKDHYPDFEVVWFGHVGDGNLHLNVLKPSDMTKEDFFDRCQKLGQILFGEIHKLKGSVSAEHGVGLIKKAHLLRSRTPEEIELMRQIKKVFDPQGILNPGKIFD